MYKFDVPAAVWGIDGDWTVNVIPEKQKFYPTDHCDVLRIKNNQLETKYVAFMLKEEDKKSFRRSYRASYR
ncbi:MAG: hypothetical protein ACTTKL_00365 [Treponema sp.]